jgi:hypothetical protein
LARRFRSCVSAAVFQSRVTELMEGLPKHHVLKQHFQDAPDHHRAFLVDQTFRRYHDARKGDIEEARKQLEATLKWREERKVHDRRYFGFVSCYLLPRMDVATYDFSSRFA